ncbi:MAG: glutamate ligase domain-containing protein, partial [Sediminibacterium sp.]
NQINVYRDFAHAPSKVKASVQAVKQQFPDKKLIGVLELHTYSSLNAEFMEEYNGALALLDEAAVFYSKHALELKRMPDLPVYIVQRGFNKEGLVVFTDKEDLAAWLKTRDTKNANILFMSSGNYDGLDIFSYAVTITKNI